MGQTKEQFLYLPPFCRELSFDFEGVVANSSTPHTDDPEWEDPFDPEELW